MGVVACLTFALPAAATGIESPSDAVLAAQMEVFQTDAPGSIFAMQPFRAEQSVEGADGLQLRLISLNPAVNSWFVLEVTPGDGRNRTRWYHLENADPDTWDFSLTSGDDAALVIEGDGDTFECRPWDGQDSQLDRARETALPYAPLCDQRMYLRNRVSGSRTSREAIAEFLRDNVFFGDSLVNLIKGAFYEDAFMQTSDTVDEGDAGEAVAALGRANLERHPVMRTYMGFDLIGTDGGQMEAGSWYAIEDAPGIYASAMQPGMIASELLNRRGETNWLDGIESRADVYLVAFDLARFEIGYEVGTDHPSFGWSSRPHSSGRDWSIPGPDGYNSPAPLVMTGMLSPSLTERVAATFTGGYKRDHGAFRYGDLALYNHGHHYGFLSNGVTLSRLQPSLSTLYVLNDGTIGMRTWTEEDEALLPQIRFARQNGVALIESDPETGLGVPGERVTLWGPGNWSGSADADLRTLRAGACTRTVDGRQFLIYAYFSTATPSAMARTFQAYGCDYAMLLDMNSQEHTYMALYTRNEDGDGLEAHHLVSGMASIDERGSDGNRIPRFVGYSDNRDFFYLLRRE